ncbi:MAG: ABC transporter [Acidobacteria bacterium 13_1_20CM_2_65_9]|nr:MAG: ABC transporter [Acidobacteria bacterium 13_1_20CM_2_65_9]
MSDAWAIDTQQLTKRYGTLDAVRSLDLKVARHGITGFLGRNGAGKSTTIKMLLGMTRPTSGSGTIVNRRIDHPRESLEARRRVAYVAEDKQTYAYMTVEQMIRFTRSFYTDWQPDLERRLLDELGLPPRRKVKALSKGMRTKLALLLALARRPELLILDEPSEGLDPVSIEELLQTLVATAAEGTTIFFSSHQIAEVERIADRVCIIDHGQLVADLSLDDMRQEYRRITLGFTSEPPVADFHMPGVEHVRTSGRQMDVFVTRNAAAVVERARRAAVVSLDVTPLTLRDVFLETVQHSLRETV